MRDEDLIDCLASGTITTVSDPMVDAFAWIPCICNREASAVEKEEKMLSIVIGDRINICVTHDIWFGHHLTLGGCNCSLASFRTMDISWDDMSSIALCRRL